jgi:uncharacterized protein YecE (DUF72 family)
MQPRDFLAYYATRFATVEVDSTFYRTPSASTVEGWKLKTPAEFIFSVKVPQTITHEKCLEDCDAEFRTSVQTMELLDDKLGPMLFQFGHFHEGAFKTVEDFYKRLIPFLKKLPKEHKFALEIRNKNWLDERFADTLREHNVALVLQDQVWMPLPAQLNFDYITAAFTYIRLLGDRKAIEMRTKVWDKEIVNRSKELWSWMDVCEKTVRRRVETYLYVNNHFSGHAPATVQQFMKLWNAKGLPEPLKPRALRQRA